MLARFLVRAVFAGLGLWLAAQITPGVEFKDTQALIAAALLLGVVNAIVRPVVIFLTLPFTIITLGLFLLVVNAGMIGLVAYLLKGFAVSGLVPGLIAAVITGLTSWVGHVVIGEGRADD